MKAKPILLLAVLLLSFTGCAFVPFPVPTHDQIKGKIITHDDVSFVVAGQTTRAELLARLGDGYRSCPRQPAISYSWDKPAVGFGWMIFAVSASDCAGGIGYYERSYWRAYFVKFDAAGRVERSQFVSLSEGHSVDEQLEEWAVKPGRSIAATISGKVFNPDTGAPRFFESLATSRR